MTPANSGGPDFFPTPLHASTYGKTSDAWISLSALFERELSWIELSVIADLVRGGWIEHNGRGYYRRKQTQAASEEPSSDSGHDV